MTPLQRIVETPQGGLDEHDQSLPQLGTANYNLKKAVKLPKDENPKEWVASLIFSFHRQISMLFGTINGYCTKDSCPEMTAGPKYKYLWSADPREDPLRLCAPEYIKHLLDWVQEQIDDQEIFPLTVGEEFPPDFMSTCKKIAKRLFRVYAHIYHHHLEDVKKLGEEAHVNTSLKYFVYFVQEFNLVEPRDLEPLIGYIEKFDITVPTS